MELNWNEMIWTYLGGGEVAREIFGFWGGGGNWRIWRAFFFFSFFSNRFEKSFCESFAFFFVISLFILFILFNLLLKFFLKRRGVVIYHLSLIIYSTPFLSCIIFWELQLPLDLYCITTTNMRSMMGRNWCGLCPWINSLINIVWVASSNSLSWVCTNSITWGQYISSSKWGFFIFLF